MSLVLESNDSMDVLVTGTVIPDAPPGLDVFTLGEVCSGFAAASY